MALDEFIDGMEPTKPGLCIIDFSVIVLSTVFATFKPKESYTENDIRKVCFNVLRANVKRFKHDTPEIVLAIDSKSGYWKRDFAPYYKGTRAAGRAKTDWDWEVIYNAMNQIIIDIKKYFPYHVIDTEKVEADDIAGVLCKNLHMKYDKIILISTDFDWSQLQRYKNVKQWNPVQGKFVRPRTESGKPPCSPDTFLKHKIIKGDRKDAIANILSPSNSITEGISQKAIKKTNYLDWLNSDPEIFCNEAMLERYRENELLLDLTKVRPDIEDKILNDFYEYKSPGRMRIYSYLLKNDLGELLDKISDF